MTLKLSDLAVEALRPGDAGYDDAARVFFAAGAPALVARPRDPGEVAAALAHAARHGLAVAVRSGGHSLLGHGTNTGGMVIDLARLNDVEIVDAGRRLVRVGGGATWGRASAVLDPRGWAITSGDTADVGVGGLTLGGGIGWLVRRYGLAIYALVVVGAAIGIYALVSSAAPTVPAPDPIVMVHTESGGVVRDTPVPIGGVPVPIDVDNGCVKQGGKINVASAE